MGMKQVPWLVDGFIAEGMTNLLLGMPHRGKSWFAEQLAVCVASGHNFLTEFPVEQGSVIFLDEDTPTSVLEWRLERLCSFLNEQLPSLPLDYRSMQGFQLDDVGDLSALKRDIAALSPPVLVIIDCLDSVVGNLDTNKTDGAKKAGQILNELKAIGATLLVLHHMSLKGEDDEKVYDSEVDFTKRAMGNTKIVANCDTAIGMWRVCEQPSNIFAVRVKPRRVLLDVPERFAIELAEYKDKGSAFLWHCGDVPRAPSDAAIEIFRLFYVNSGKPYTVKEVRHETGDLLSDRDTRNALKELDSENVLQMGKKKHNLYKYQLSPGFPRIDTQYADALRAAV